MLTGRRDRVDHKLTGDPQQKSCIRRWRGDHTIFDHKDVVPRSLSHLTFGVQHDGFVEALPESFTFGQDVVEVIQALDRRIQAFHRDTRSFGDDDFHAISVHLFRIQADAVGDADHTWLWTTEWVQTQGAFAAGQNQTDVAVLKVVGRHGLAGEILNLVDAQFRIQMDALGRLHQTHQVRPKLEDPSVVNSDALEDTVSVEKAMVKDTDLGLRAGNQMPIDPNQSLIGGGRGIGT